MVRETKALLGTDGSPFTTLLFEYHRAEAWGISPQERAQAWWRDLQDRIVSKHPQADRLALYWLCHFQPRASGVAAWRSDPRELLSHWVIHRPVPEAPEILTSLLRESVSALTADTPVQRLPEAAVALEPDPLPVSVGAIHRLMDLLWELRGPVQPAGPATSPASRQVADLAFRFFQWLLPRLGSSVAHQDLIDRVMAELPQLPSYHWVARPGEGGLETAVNRYLQLENAGKLSPKLRRVLLWYLGWRGFDHFLAACRQFARAPGQKPPLTANLQWGSGADGPLTWATLLLVRIKPPTEADLARSGELAAIPADVLLTAAALAPAWVRLVEPQLQWPGLAAFLQWLLRHGEMAYWTQYRRWVGEAAEEEAGGPVDGAPALEAIGRMGEKRLAKLLRHPVIRSKYRNGLYYLKVIRGENAADVEAGFVSRNKLAVRALGLLPPEDDTLQRYLALRRFWNEAKQFGAKRQGSERQAAEDGLANLAVTAGYDDLANLEWAMEAQLAQEIDPTSRSWSAGDYVVRIGPDEKASLLVERGGQLLKSLPPAVRESPVYDEIKEARELLKAQWQRVVRRLELAMATGEIMDRATFAPALTTPAGRRVLPTLVLRCWPTGQAAPVELLNLTSLDGTAFAVDDLERLQVAHSITLRQADTLGSWQRRLASEGLVQPFNQLFREVYTRRPSESAGAEIHRFAGRKVRVGTLTERLKRLGWRTDYEGALVRRLPGRREATFHLTDGAAWYPATEVLTAGVIWLDPQAGPLDFSEMLREVDLCTAQAAPDRSMAPV